MIDERFITTLSEKYKITLSDDELKKLEKLVNLLISGQTDDLREEIAKEEYSVKVLKSLFAWFFENSKLTKDDIAKAYADFINIGALDRKSSNK